MEPAIEVTLEYKLVGEKTWRQSPIGARAYFDPEYTSEYEPLDIEDVPLYDHAVSYLSMDISVIQNTRITIADLCAGKERVIVETFWNGGLNRIIERRDLHQGLEQYWEMIIDSQVRGRAATSEITRIGRSDSVISVLSHVFITNNPDGSQTESRVYPDD